MLILSEVGLKPKYILRLPAAQFRSVLDLMEEKKGSLFLQTLWEKCEDEGYNGIPEFSKNLILLHQRAKLKTLQLA
jgi:hypothetical protein